MIGFVASRDNRNRISDRRAIPDMARQRVRSFGIIVAIFIILLVGSLATSWIAIKVVDATRAYATGEGRYSKAQKIAVLDLHRFAYSEQPSDYDAFLAAIAVPRGDRAARLALEHDPVDTAAAAAGFLQGQNHPDDIDGLILLFRTFSWWSPFAAAVADWRDGDRLVGELIEQGVHIKGLIAARQFTPELRAGELQVVNRIDDALTQLENTFSTHMGEAARAATALVVIGLGMTTILLWAIGMVFAAHLFRQQQALDRQLSTSEQRFRDYAEVGSDWYWELDAGLRLSYLSERFFEVTDASRDSVIDRREDGEIRYLSLSAKPYFSAAGAFLGYRGVGSDITSIEEDARMLREAKDRAETANRAKSEFLANMSHELRTPLNAIIGFSEIIMNRLFGPSTVDRHENYARDIHSSGKLLLSIIDEILDLSKIEAGREELSEAEIGLDEILSETQQLFAGRFEQAQLQLRIDLPTPAPRVFVDARKLMQCLTNLLSNGLKFTPQGGSVTVSASFQADHSLSIAVRDTGIGIAPNDMATVLSPFGQVETAFSRAHPGTGLGLPITKSLIELHGGTLTVESILGKGTVVTLNLPPERVLGQASEVAAGRTESVGLRTGQATG